MTEAERQEKIPEYATLIVEWFPSTDLAHCDWEMFWEQVNSALYGGFPWLFKDEAPKPNGTIPDEDPWKVIEWRKVKNKDLKFVNDIINHNAPWLARWLQRVIPDQAMVKAVLHQAETQIRREARTARWA